MQVIVMFRDPGGIWMVLMMMGSTGLFGSRNCVVISRRVIAMVSARSMIVGGDEQGRVSVLWTVVEGCIVVCEASDAVAVHPVVMKRLSTMIVMIFFIGLLSNFFGASIVAW